MRRSIIGLLFISGATLLGAPAGQAQQQAAQQGNPPMYVIAGRTLGASPAAAALPPAAATHVRGAMPLGVRPPPPRPPGAPFADPALQTAYPPPAVAKTILTKPILDFAGLGVDFPGLSICCSPPDTNAAVGTTQVVETVNLSFAVFSKFKGSKLAGPTDLSALYTSVGGQCENGSISDPVVLFDHFSRRWVITFLAAANFNPFTSPFLQCIAVSQSADATGKYFLYSYDVTNLPLGDDVFNDYGKMGVWRDGFYMSFNEFPTNGNNSLGAAACAFPSASMIAGSAGSMICFGPIASEFGLLPSDADGRTPPHKGEPDFYIGSLDGSEHFNLWKFHVDFSTPTNSTFTGPTTLQVAPYTETCIDQCIPQPSGGDLLEGLGDRLMFRAAYRNFRTHESIVVSHSVAVSAASFNTVGVRWYEIRKPDAANPVIFQQGTFAPDASFRWMPSIAMDRRGDIALGYSVSDATSVFPSIRYTGRTPSQKPGAMTAELPIVAGAADLNDDGFDRWGDYSSMAIDPIDGCTFWYAQEYVSQSGTFNWSTRLASFRFKRCP